MAVVRKTSETRNRNLAKATIRYIMHRRELGERITRPLFSGEEGDSQKLAAYEAIDHAPPGTRFLRVTVSPDPKREDTNRDLNLRELTRSALSALQERFPDQGHPVLRLSARGTYRQSPCQPAGSHARRPADQTSLEGHA
jgi:hypothetical protein